MIETRELSFFREKTKILDNISIKINKGDFVGIFGKTGSGKSTFLQHLNALLNPDNGVILLDGEKIVQKKDTRRKVGLVFQSPEQQLFCRTVLEDVMFGPLNFGFTKSQALESSVKALREAGLGPEFDNRDPFSLCGGEKRLASIAGVLSFNPQVLVLDEPGCGLDFETNNTVFSLLERLNKEGRTIIIVSHNSRELFRYCNRLFEMKEGRLTEIKKENLVFREVVELCDMIRAKGISVPYEICNPEGLLNFLSPYYNANITEELNVQDNQ